MNVGTCDLARVSVCIQFYLISPSTTKTIDYCWYVRGSDTNTTDTVFFNMGNLVAGNFCFLSRDVRSDFYNAFGFQLNDSWQIVNMVVSLRIKNASTFNSIDLLVGEVRVHGNYVNVTKSDINNDENVDIKDLAEASKAYGSVPGDPNWDPRADVNLDLTVDIKDISRISRDYGS